MEGDSEQLASDERFNAKEHAVSLVAALRGELHGALRAELPLALRRELPQALGQGARTGAVARPSGFSAPGHVPDAPTTGQPGLMNIVSALDSLQDSDPEEDDLMEQGKRLMANKYNAKQFYLEVNPKRKSEISNSNRTSLGVRRISNGRVLNISEPDDNGHKHLRHAADAEAPPASQEAWQPIQKDVKKDKSDALDLRVVSLPKGGQERRAKTVQVDQLSPVQRHMLGVVTHIGFTCVTILGICVNAITIGLQTDWDAKNLPKDTHLAFKAIEIFFCIAFTIELIMRFLAFRLAFFCNDEWRWNMFDTFLVSVTLIEQFVELIITKDGKLGVNVSFMRVLRVLRLVRVVRLVRIVRLISELRTIVSSVANSLKSLVFTILIIAFLIYIMAVFITQMVTEKLRNDPDDKEAHENLSKFFNSVSMCCLVLFQSMTGGIDWGDITSPLIDHISPGMAVIYCLYVSFAVFAMLNVITGVFVESALASDAQGKDADMVGRLHEFFCNWGCDGVLTWDDFSQALDDKAIQVYFESVDLDVAEARGLFRLLDSDKSGTVEAEEFVMGCLRLKGEAKAIDLATLMYENRHWHHRLSSRLHRLEEMEKRVVEEMGRLLCPPTKAAWSNAK